MSVSATNGGLLAASARTTLTPEQRARLVDEVARVVDWTGEVQAALGHGTAGLLCRHLLTLPEDLVPGDISSAASAFIEQLHIAHATGVAQLLDLLGAFTQAGITAIPFKGPALAQLAYSEPALRPFSDLDILVSATDVARVLRLLHDRGYRSQHSALSDANRSAYLRYNGQDVLFAPDRLPVEPHWQFAQRTLCAPVDTDGMLARAVPLALGGRTISGLSVEDSVLAAGFHGSKDQWVGLRAITDMAELLRTHADLDWDAVLRRAEATGVRRMVLLGAALARRVLDARLPEDITRAITSDPVCLALVEQVCAGLFADPQPVPSIFALSGFRWRMRERLADRLAYAARTIFTPRVQHFGIVDLPDLLRFLYPLIKVGHDFVALPLWRAARGPAQSEGKQAV